MKERGMIFNDEMVRAILDGRKTQTRRPVNEKFRGLDDENWEQSTTLIVKRCPFGTVGDRIWVRETYQGPLFDYEHMDSYLEDSSKFEKPEFCVYRADGKPAPEFYDADDNLHCFWRPSIHMPRWASRITLEITDVRVERLNNISECDAKAEGAPTECCVIGDKHFLGFRSLWKSIYGEEGWQANPWVWVIEFKRVDGGTTP